MEKSTEYITPTICFKILFLFDSDQFLICIYHLGIYNTRSYPFNPERKFIEKSKQSLIILNNKAKIRTKKKGKKKKRKFGI